MVLTPSQPNVTSICTIFNSWSFLITLSMVILFPLPRGSFLLLWVFKSYTVPTSNAISSKILPWFPRWNTRSSLQAVITHDLTQCLFVHDPKFFRCTGTHTGLCSHLSPAPAPSPPLPSQAFNSCHRSGCRIHTHCSAPLWHETLVRQAPPRGWGCLVRKPL